MRLSKYLLILAALPSLNTWSAEYTLKWGLNVEPIVYFQKAAADFKKRVEQRTNGRIKVEVYENLVPQEGHDHLADVQKGIYHMNQETVFHLQKRVPELAIWDLPYLFQNDEHVSRYIASAPAREILAKLEGHDVVGLGYTYSGGFLHIFGRKLSSFSDLNNLNVGFEEAAETYKTYLQNLFKLTPQKISFGTYTETNPTQAASEIIISTGRELYPIAKKSKVYLNTTDHRVISRVLFVSKKFLESLPSDLRKIVIEEGQRAAKLERELSIQDKNAVLSEAESKNVVINRWSQAQKNQQRDQFKPLYAAYVKKFGEASIKHVEELRAR